MIDFYVYFLSPNALVCGSGIPQLLGKLAAFCWLLFLFVLIGALGIAFPLNIRERRVVLCLCNKESFSLKVWFVLNKQLNLQLLLKGPHGCLSFFPLQE